jgi:DNA-binding transcriptional ArsR family regulator
MKKSLEKEVYALHANLCRALADPKRILILYELSTGKKSVNELVENLGFRQGNISQHLMVLRERSLVKAQRDGTSVYYSLADKRIIEALDLMRGVLMETLSKGSRLASSFTGTS